MWNLFLGFFQIYLNVIYKKEFITFTHAIQTNAVKWRICVNDVKMVLIDKHCKQNSMRKAYIFNSYIFNNHVCPSHLRRTCVTAKQPLKLSLTRPERDEGITLSGLNLFFPLKGEELKFWTSHLHQISFG